jgi:hypothetical protein
VETPVFGFALEDRARNREMFAATTALFEGIRAGQFVGFVSDYSLAELGATADAALRARLLAIPGMYGLRRLPGHADASRVAQVLVERGLVPPGKAADAEHLAMMALHTGLDVLVSWNYRHIVNVSVKRSLTPVLLELGFRVGFEIATPQEVVGQDE